MGERDEAYRRTEGAVLAKQDQEVNALRQRIQAGAEEQRVARQQDLERLLRRYRPPAIHPPRHMIPPALP
jgi:hypothetical protein